MNTIETKGKHFSDLAAKITQENVQNKEAVWGEESWKMFVEPLLNIVEFAKNNLKNCSLSSLMGNNRVISIRLNRYENKELFFQAVNLMDNVTNISGVTGHARSELAAMEYKKLGYAFPPKIEVNSIDQRLKEQAVELTVKLQALHSGFQR